MMNASEKRRNERCCFAWRTMRASEMDASSFYYARRRPQCIGEAAAKGVAVAARRAIRISTTRARNSACAMKQRAALFARNIMLPNCQQHNPPLTRRAERGKNSRAVCIAPLLDRLS